MDGQHLKFNLLHFRLRAASIHLSSDLQCDGESIRSRVDPVSLNDACADVSVNDLSNSSEFGSVNKSSIKPRFPLCISK